jgi:hypothetical protein
MLVIGLSIAMFLSDRKAKRKGERSWNATSRRLIIHMAVPLVTGGLLCLILISFGYAGLLVPVTLIFYGLALFNAGTFTYTEVKYLGILQILLGLASMYAITYGLLFWSAGFGFLNIIYGLYIHYTHER